MYLEKELIKFKPNEQEKIREALKAPLPMPWAYINMLVNMTFRRKNERFMRYFTY